MIVVIMTNDGERRMLMMLMIVELVMANHSQLSGEVVLLYCWLIKGITTNNDNHNG